jgi:hypothetical protein
MALSDCLAWKLPIAALQEIAARHPACSAALYRNISTITFRLLMSTVAHFKDERQPAEHVERCPSLVLDGFLSWRLNGALIEAKCGGRPGCGVRESSCPAVRGPTSEWATLMLGKYSSLLQSGSYANQPVARPA